jgi:hypothetical protein
VKGYSVNIERSIRGLFPDLADQQAWSEWLRGLRTTDWVVYAKPPFGGPERVLKYLSRYTHRLPSPTTASSPSRTVWCASAGEMMPITVT